MYKLLFFLLLSMGSAYAQVPDEEMLLIPIEMTINTTENPSLKNLSIEELSFMTMGGILYESKPSSVIQTQVQGLLTPYLRKQIMLSKDNYLNENRFVNFEVKLKSVYNYNDKMVVIAEMKGRYGLTFENTHNESIGLYSQNLQTYLEDNCGGCGVTYTGQGSASDIKISVGLGNDKQTLKAYYQYDQQASDNINRAKRYGGINFKEQTQFERHTKGLELTQKLKYGEFFLRGETSYSQGQLLLFNFVDDVQEVEKVEFNYMPTMRLGLEINLETKLK